MVVSMKKRGLIVFLFIVAAIILAGLYLVSSNEKLVKQDSTKYKSIDDFKTKKITEVHKSMLSKADKKAQLVIDEQELSDLAAVVIKDYEKSADAVEISGYSAQIDSDGITIKLDSKILDLLPTQYVFKIKPSIVDNRINLVVSEFKVGKLPISPKLLLKQIQTSDKSNYYVDLQLKSIVLENKYPKQMIFNDIKFEKDKMSIELTLSVKSLKDLKNILGTVFPDVF